MTYPDMLSILVWCKRDNQTNTVRLQIVDVVTASEIYFKEASFLLRITRDTDTGIDRCLIRHIASGREAYVQGGPRLDEFVAACLVDEETSHPADRGTTGG